MLTTAGIAWQGVARRIRARAALVDMPPPLHFDRTPSAWPEVAGPTAPRGLSPYSIADLPAAFAELLDAIGCTLPETGPSFVVGEFAAKGQSDVAAICVRGDVSSIAVHFGGPARCPTFAVGWNENSDFIEATALVAGVPLFEFARTLEVVHSGDDSVQYSEAALGVRFDHDGFTDWHDSVRNYATFYCQDGRWLGSLGHGE